MDTANILVALGGDRGNVVPKAGVTPGEILALQAIHGPDSVFDVEPAGKVDRNNAEELGRIRTLYGGERDESGRSKIADLFPGAGARVPTTIKSLDLPSESFKPKTRATADDVAAAGGSMAYREEPGATGYEPIEVPADPDHNVEGGMVDPRSQPQVDLPPGLAMPTTTDVKATVEKKATNKPKSPLD
ncbi:hypothetical protein [Methylorubrum zatmanii]